MIDLHTADTRTWRALIARAEAEVMVNLAPDVEAYLNRMLVRNLSASAAAGARQRLLIAGPTNASSGLRELSEIGDRALLVSGLFPDLAACYAIPVSSLIDIGKYAYRVCAARAEEPLFACIARDFVRIMDVLRTMRELDDGVRGLDAFSAHQRWLATGSLPARHDCRDLNAGLPLAMPSTRVH
jgi:hypothetical protein